MVNGPLSTDVLLATANDARHPPSNMIDADEKSFWITTGMFPHEIVLGFKAGQVNISKIATWSYHIRKIVIEKSTESQPTKFERVTEIELTDKNGAMQIEQFQVNPS